MYYTHIDVYGCCKKKYGGGNLECDIICVSWFEMFDFQRTILQAALIDSVFTKVSIIFHYYNNVYVVPKRVCIIFLFYI
jgi:hypothetical protein